MTATAIPLGQLLIDHGLIGPEDLDRALELQRERGDKLGKILVDMGFIAQRDLLLALSEQLGLVRWHRSPHRRRPPNWMVSHRAS